MVAALVVALANGAQVEQIEYEMVEVVRPRPERGYSNCADINDNNVAIAMSGGEKLALSGGVGSVFSWVWHDERAERIKGVADYVVVMQIESDGTIGALVPVFENGVHDWRPGYVRDGRAYMSGLSSPYIDYIKPYDHNGGLSGVLQVVTSEVQLTFLGTESVPIPKPASKGPGTPPAGTVEVPKYSGEIVPALHIYGGIDKDGAWAGPPTPERLVVLSNRRGVQVTKVHSAQTLGRPMKTLMWEWRTLNGNPDFPYPWHKPLDRLKREYPNSTVHVLAMNDHGWATYSIIDPSLPDDWAPPGKKPDKKYGGFIVTERSEARLKDFGGLVCLPFGLNEDGAVVGSADTTSGSMRGMIWKATSHDLNDVTFDRHGWVISSGNAINNNGWIAATAIKGKQYAAFVLRPLKFRSIKRAARMAFGALYDGVLGAKIGE